MTFNWRSISLFSDIISEFVSVGVPYPEVPRMRSVGGLALISTHLGRIDEIIYGRSYWSEHGDDHPSIQLQVFLVYSHQHKKRVFNCIIVLTGRETMVLSR